MRLMLFLVLFYHPVIAQFPDITISSEAQPQEVSIAINPKNNRQIIAGANLASSYFSENGGFNWKRNTLICDKYNVYGDPVLFWDYSQNAYYMHLSSPDKKITADGSWVDRIVINKSTDNGKSFPQCFGFGKNGKKVQDKHWMCVDEKTNTIHVTWTQFDKYESRESTDSSIIRYSNSNNGCLNWTEPKKISFYNGDCLDDDNTVEGATPAIGTDGEIYVAWAGPKGLVFQKSIDGGKTWFEKEKIIASIKNGWTYNVQNVYRANGLPFMVCDLSKGPQRGRIYICWGDEKNGETNKDVFLIYSDDKGESWTDPILITYHPNHKEQFMPFLSIDQTTGYIYILYYDRQNYSGNDITDVYMAKSINGGLKFEYFKVNNSSFKTDKEIFFGDYIGLSAVNGEIRPIWMQMDDEKKLSAHTAIINDSTIDIYKRRNAIQDLIIENTVQFSEKIKLNFSLKQKKHISVFITKPLDPLFKEIKVKSSKFKIGNNILLIKPKRWKLKKGNYVLTLYYEGKNKFVWITEE